MQTVKIFPKARHIALISLILMLILAVTPVSADDLAPSISENTTNSLPPTLTQNEKNWLGKHLVIRVAFDDSLPPFSFADDKGNFNGIAVDIFNAISAKLNIRFQHSSRKSWRQIYDALARHRVDVVATMVDRPERRFWFNFTHPYLTKSLTVIARADDQGITNSRDLAGKTVAYIKDYQFSEGLKKIRPPIKTHAVNSMLDCLLAVKSESADACITFLGTANYLQSKHNMNGLKNAGFYERHTADESVAVRGDWPILAQILQKGLDAISEAEMNAIYLKWTPPQPSATPNLKDSSNTQVDSEAGKALTKEGLTEVNLPILFILLYILLWRQLLRRRKQTANPLPPPTEVATKTELMTLLPDDFERMLLKRATDIQNNDVRFRNLIENQSKNYFFFQCDKLGHINYVSPSVSTMLGYPPEAFLANFKRCVTENTENKSFANFLALSRQGMPCSPFALEVYDSTNSRRWLEITTEPVFDEFGNCIGVDCLVFEITRRKHADERLIWLSFHDELTGLGNRRLFIDRLKQAIALAKRHNKPFAVHYLDLDGFKLVNDKLGHAAGDYALKEIARKISTTLRDTDTAARLGGDEFALLLPESDEKASTAVAEKILDIMKEPIPFGEETIHFGASIGIAIFPRHGNNSDELLRAADASMYHAKQRKLGYSFETVH